MVEEGQTPQDSCQQLKFLPLKGTRKNDIYPKNSLIIQNMEFIGEGGLVKDGIGIAKVLQVGKKKKGLGLGATLAAVDLEKRFAIQFHSCSNKGRKIQKSREYLERCIFY
jgi:hypothetical protein